MLLISNICEQGSNEIVTILVTATPIVESQRYYELMMQNSESQIFHF